MYKTSRSAFLGVGPGNSSSISFYDTQWSRIADSLSWPWIYTVDDTAVYYCQQLCQEVICVLSPKILVWLREEGYRPEQGCIPDMGPDAASSAVLLGENLMLIEPGLETWADSQLVLCAQCCSDKSATFPAWRCSSMVTECDILYVV